MPYVKQATADGLLTNPLKFDDLLTTAADALTVDQDLDLRELALAVRDIRPANISYATVPYTSAGLRTPCVKRSRPAPTLPNCTA